VVYDRRSDLVTTDQQGASSGVLDMFDVTDALVASLLDGLSGTHLLFGSLAVESEPAGATVSVNGKDVGTAPLSLRGLPVGAVELTGRLEGREGAKATVTIVDGETTNASLRLARSMGTLVVGMPKDAVGRVRSAEVGQKEVTGSGTAALPTGEYEVEAICPGLPGVSGKVTINRNARTSWLPWPKGYLDVQSDPGGAVIVVDGQERGAAPLVVEVEPGTPHRVELRKDKYETYTGDISAAAGDKTSLTSELVPLPGSISVATSIAGASVKLDYDREGVTPFVFDKVAPGEHVVEIANVKVGNRLYTVGDPVQVEVSAGETTVLSKSFAEGKGQLTIQDAPRGSIVEIDGKSVDSEKALTTGIEVPAGWVDITVTAPDSGKWTGTAVVGPGNATWSSTHTLTWRLPRRTISLDGKPDSWGGIEPLSDMFSASSVFMGETRFAMAQVFMCRDDKNLYWRVDFAETNPILNRPKGTKRAIACELSVQLEPGKQLNLGANYWGPGRRMSSYGVLYDDMKHQVSQQLANTEDFRNSDKMLVARIRLDQVTKYCKGPVYVSFRLGDDRGDGNWDDSQISETRSIDFSQ
jgi:hypothetical protein